PVGYLHALCQRISQVADTDDHFNYLTIIQSSGYGKTRAGCELAAEFPFVYVCFRESGSTGYPLATLKSMDMLRNINAAKDVDEAEVEALGWIRSIVSMFHEKKEEFCKKQPQEKYQQALLKDQQQATDFWNTVNANHGKEEMPQTKEKIILFINEASALLSKKKDQVDVTKKNQAFRAVRHALFKYKAYVTGLLTDTNSLVANLAPQLEHDPSWQSAESWETNQNKFRNIILFAKFKLLGGTNQWNQDVKMKRKAVLALGQAFDTYPSSLEELKGLLKMLPITEIPEKKKDSTRSLIGQKVNFALKCQSGAHYFFGKLDYIFAFTAAGKYLQLFQLLHDYQTWQPRDPQYQVRPGFGASPSTHGGNCHKHFLMLPSFEGVDSFYYTIITFLPDGVHKKIHNFGMLFKYSKIEHPCSLQMLKEAMKSVLTGLNSLHTQGYVHQDIRWENVLRRREEEGGGWMIIDLEHAGQPRPINYRLQYWPPGDGGKEIGSQPYTNACNMYLVGIGKLMVDCSNVILDSSSENFLQRLLSAVGTDISVGDVLSDTWLQ
ncbi:8725_t:CDS:2, partial [Paraglomus brasilianum]